MRHRQELTAEDYLYAGVLWFLIISALMIGGAAVLRFRKAYLEPESEPEDVLETLRKAHRAGEIDDQEFGRVRQSLESPLPPKSNPRPRRPRPRVRRVPSLEAAGSLTAWPARVSLPSHIRPSGPRSRR